MKNERQDKILELIMKYTIETQEELMFKLKESGFDVTQATVSRDIRQMKLSKVPTSSGGLRYVSYHKASEDMNEKYRRIFSDGFISMDNAQNIIVIKTVSGMAMAAAAALDNMNFQEIVGCIAGDDTIMCAMRSMDDAVVVMRRLRSIVDEEE